MMRVFTGGVSHVASVVERDLFDRETGLRKQHIEGISDAVACALSCRSANTAEWQAVLPRQTVDEKSKERYISRLLGNDLIVPLTVMGGLLPEIAEMAASKGKSIVLPMDQSKISAGFECLMLSIRTGERALPLAWKVKETSGGIGFDVQEPLLNAVHAMLPEGIPVLLAADRFYGTAALIRWCQEHGWGYRLRLKDNLILRHEGGEITTGEAAQTGITRLLNAELNESGVKTHIGILHEKNHKEPWVIAMSEPPSKGRVLDYGMRWGIEPMFSDFKSRGFGITKTQLKHANRIERMILVLTLALFGAASAGMQPRTIKHTPKKKKEA
jgi:Transposase DDE domain